MLSFHLLLFTILIPLLIYYKGRHREESVWIAGLGDLIDLSKWYPIWYPYFLSLFLLPLHIVDAMVGEVAKAA